MADVLDSTLMQNNFGTAEVRAIWTDKNKIAKQLQVEAVLSKVEGQLGVIPAAAAQKIVEQAKLENFDIEALAKESAQKRHSLIGLINHLQKLAGSQAGEYVHFGATTQDIVDTGIVLQTKEAYQIIVADSKKLITVLKKQARNYRSTVMIGRTHGIQAIPITFGYKLAVWLDEALRNHQRLVKLAENGVDGVFVGNLNGAVGTYAAFGEKGPEIERLALKELDLNVPDICWQSSRDRFSEFAAVLGIYSGLLGKIGHELFNLMKTEVDEVREPFKKGEIGSSTMPQKRNPALIEGLASLAQPAFKDVGLMLESLLFDGERDAMHWRNEWIVLPEITNYLDAQLKSAAYILDDMQVNEKQMLRNIELQRGLPFAEKIMFNLGKVVGKQSAHKLVYQCAMETIEKKEHFIEVLYRQADVKNNFTKEDLIGWTDPQKDLGSILEKVDQVVSKAEKVS
jgi:adenylosuccinate lyase